MEKTFGQYLEDTDAFYNRIGDAVCCSVVLNAVAQSGLLDVLGNAPAPVGDLSDATGIPAPALQRLANFLAAHEFVDLLDDGRIAPNARTPLVRDAASMIQCNIIGALAGSALYPALKQGKIPFEQYYGKPVFEHLSANPGLGAIFGNFMGFMTRRDERFLFAHHIFEPFEVVADIGGSHGDLLLAMLERHPGTRGILFDLPHTVAQAEAAVSASPHAARVEIVGGSFFEKVPAADLYLLKQILHDWNDEECVHILKSIRAAILPGGRLAVIDHVLAERPTPSEGLTTDIWMMIWDTGKERKRSEFEALFAASGFRIDRVTPNPHGHSVIEVVPV